LGDGWYGWWTSGELAPHLDALRGELDRAGRREGDDFHVQLGIPLQRGDTEDTVLAKVEAARRCGVAELILGLPISPRDVDGDLARWAGALGA
jgi:alkanesulfonate monooxygenase SsuD/methylene tetrahydromethanopterin reductase-like flavin-dependent oxidoreductase (luciferase family)